jgi:diacylglycerol kinase family enzyme
MHDTVSTVKPVEAAPSMTRLPVGLLSNPHSGRNRRQLHHIEDIVANHTGVHHRLTGSPEEIPAALQELAGQGVGVLGINGGDGTIARVLTDLLLNSPFEQQPLVVLLPGGTTNMNVGDVGIRGSLKRAVTRFCEWADSRDADCELLQRPVLRVQPGTGQPPVCGMFFGAGAIIQGIEYCHASIHSKGLGNEVGPGLAMARTIWGIMRRDDRFLKPVPVAVTLDSGTAGTAQEELLLLVSTLERLFLGMYPYWGKGDGPLHISMVRNDATRLLRTLPSLLRGKPGRHATEAAGYRSYNCTTIRLELDGTWTLDGELYQAHRTTGPVTITSGGTVTFLRL